MNQYRDRMFKDKVKLFDAVLQENHDQVEKWGVQIHTIFEWLTYTTEELGSLAKAIGEYEYRDGPIDDVIKEAVQVATLSLKIAEMYRAKKKEVYHARQRTG